RETDLARGAEAPAARRLCHRHQARLQRTRCELVTWREHGLRRATISRPACADLSVPPARYSDGADPRASERTTQSPPIDLVLALLRVVAAALPGGRLGSTVRQALSATMPTETGRSLAEIEAYWREAAS